MRKLREKALHARDAKRDLNAELLASVRDRNLDASVILETLLRHAMDQALQAHADGNLEREMAYYDILDIGKEQAELMGHEFADRELQAFDPDELLKKPG